jgi:hypothetical protein
MTPNVQVGTILIEDRPIVTRILDLEGESYSGNWSVVNAIDGFALDPKIHAAGDLERLNNAARRSTRPTDPIVSESSTPLL